MTTNIFKKQIANRNFLSAVGFKFILNRAPKTAFFGNYANIPGLNLGVSIQPTYLKDIDIPGTKMTFNDFTLKFLVDENLENYMEIQNWMRGIGYPETLQEIYDWQANNDNIEQPTDRALINLYSDATLNILTSSQTPNFKVKFLDLFPVALSDLEFDATNTDVEYFTAEATFKYTIYNIVDLNDRPL